MNENNNSSQNSTAMLIAVFAAILILPWIFNEYLLKYYLAAWYYLIFAKLWVVYKLTSITIIAQNLDVIDRKSVV